MAFCNRGADTCLYRVTYSTVGKIVAHWDLMAKDKAHALTSAAEILPIGSQVMFAHLKEEW